MGGLLKQKSSPLPDLGDFARQAVLDVKMGSGQEPKLESCQQVVRVAPISVAAAGGIQVGDVLWEVDGAPAARIPPPAERRIWRFYRASTGQQIDLVARPIDPGLWMIPTGEAIEAAYTPPGNPQALLLLWESGDWERLQRLSQRDLEARVGKLDEFEFTDANPGGLCTPSLALYGAACYELGDQPSGLWLLNFFDRHYASKFSVDFQALVASYQARQAMAARPQEAQQMLDQCFRYYPCDRIGALVEQAGGTRPKRTSRWLGKPFPVRYHFPRLGPGDDRVSLDQTLRTLGAGQVLVVCSLATYRGNGPSDQFLRRYHAWYRGFRPYLPALHVITQQPDRRTDRPHWYKAEDEAVADKVPMVILREDGSLTTALQAECSPYILALDGQGTVVHEYIVTDPADADIWSILAAARRTAAR